MKALKVLLFLTLSVQIFGQKEIDYREDRPNNTISHSTWGDGITGITYERLFFIHPEFLIVAKLGLAYSQNLKIFGGSTDHFILFPHHLTANFGRKYVFGEIGLGGSIVRGDGFKDYYIYPMAGIRFLPIQSKRIFFKIYLQVPYSIRGVLNAFITPVGVNFGIAF